MVQRERSVHVSTSNGLVNNKNRVEVSRRKKCKDDMHWDFLDEIEAPMWLDLTKEFQSTYHDKDDEWFDISHPFHQGSSRQLMSAFSHSVEGCTNFNLDVLDQSSPQLPDSVSRSRGKECRSRGWREGNQRVTFNQQHPVKNLSKKSLNVDLESKRMARNKRSSGMTIEPPGSMSDSTGESNLTHNAGQQDLNSLPPSSNLKFCLNYNFSKKGESNSTSTITFEGSGQQQQKSLEVSSQGFLSALIVSLRKSCVTRQASRMEVVNRRLSEGEKSSSSKSSVGSSSNLGFGGKYLKARENKDMTPDRRNIVRISKAPNIKVNKEKLSTAPAVRCRDITSNPKFRSQNFTVQSIYQGNAKLKVHQRTLQAKVLAPEGVKKHCAPSVAVKTKEKTAASHCGRIPGAGKENPAAKVVVSQKSSSRDALQVQKVIKRRMTEKSGRTKLLGAKERTNGRSEQKKAGTIAEKVYFR